jgi:hypothetical protein
MNRRSIIVILVVCLALSGWFLSRAPVDTAPELADGPRGAGAEEAGGPQTAGEPAGSAAGGRTDPLADTAGRDALLAPGTAAATPGAAAAQDDEAPGPRSGDALSLTDFDYAAAVRTVRAAGLSPLRQRAAITALEEARDDPGMRAEALARARRLLGRD